jgi:hypothetical protein
MASLFGVQRTEEFGGGFDERAFRHVPLDRLRSPAEDLYRSEMFVGSRKRVIRFQQLLHGGVHGSPPKERFTPVIVA